MNRYPEPMRKKMMRLRQLILDTALETEGGEAVFSLALTYHRVKRLPLLGA